MKTAERQPRLIDINLLPRDQRPLEVALAAAAVFIVLLLCVAAIVPLALREHDARNAADAVERQADNAERGLRQVQLDLTRHRALRTELENAKAELAKLQQERTQLQGGRRPLDSDLTMLYGYGSFLPGGVRITAISGAGQALKVDGVAPGPLDAIAYADTLVASGGFVSAQMSAFTPATDGGGQFTIEVAR
jgi:Tfp pilus assembly protein PilN